MSEFLEKLLAGFLGALAGVGIMIIIAACFGEAKASPYGFPPTPEQPEVLMHIQYKHGGGGTHKCSDLRDCYVKHLNYEARGAEQYCRKIVITEDGVVRWWRKYSD